MTTLKCTAVTCFYNKDHLCSKGSIDITGEGAEYADETTCGSFRKRSEDSAQNSADSGCGCNEIQIDCKAQHCTYNEHCKCTASAIHVGGGHANASKETCCDTFESKA